MIVIIHCADLSSVARGFVTYRADIPKVLEERNDSEMKEPTYAPYEDIDNITLGKMLDKLNAHGKIYDRVSILNRINPQTLKRINRIWDIYYSDLSEVKISDLWSLPDDKEDK